MARVSSLTGVIGAADAMSQTARSAAGKAAEIAEAVLAREAASSSTLPEFVT